MDAETILTKFLSLGDSGKRDAGDSEEAATARHGRRRRPRDDRRRQGDAHDVRRYDVVKDVERLERLLAAGVADHGVAVVLTNVAAFWAPSAARNTFDRSFRIHQDATLTGTLDWAPGTGDGTKKNRDKALVLRGSYRMSWVDYATVGTGPGSTFRALVVPVGG